MQKHAGFARFRHGRTPCLTGNGNCLLQYIEEPWNIRLMLDALIETVAYDPLAIFLIVAMVLVVMLVRTP
jgi:hypothetical protein